MSEPSEKNPSSTEQQQQIVDGQMESNVSIATTISSSAAANPGNSTTAATASQSSSTASNLTTITAAEPSTLISTDHDSSIDVTSIQLPPWSSSTVQIPVTSNTSTSSSELSNTSLQRTPPLTESTVITMLPATSAPTSPIPSIPIESSDSDDDDEDDDEEDEFVLRLDPELTLPPTGQASFLNQLRQHISFHDIDHASNGVSNPTSPFTTHSLPVSPTAIAITAGEEDHGIEEISLPPPSDESANSTMTVNTSNNTTNESIVVIPATPTSPSSTTSPPPMGNFLNDRADTERSLPATTRPRSVNQNHLPSSTIGAGAAPTSPLLTTPTVAIETYPSPSPSPMPVMEVSISTCPISTASPSLSSMNASIASSSYPAASPTPIPVYPTPVSSPAPTTTFTSERIPGSISSAVTMSSLTSPPSSPSAVQLSASLIGFEMVYADGTSSISTVASSSSSKSKPKFTLYKILVTSTPLAPSTSPPHPHPPPPLATSPSLERRETSTSSTHLTVPHPKLSKVQQLLGASGEIDSSKNMSKIQQILGADSADQADEITAATIAASPPPSVKHSRSYSSASPSSWLSTSGARERSESSAIHRPQPSQSWFIFKRYSDFHTLHHKLLSIPEFGGVKNIEKNWLLFIPPKVRAPACFSSGVIETRYSLFDTYLKTLCQREELCQHELVLKFLGVIDDPSGNSNGRGKQMIWSNLLAKLNLASTHPFGSNTSISGDRINAAAANSSFTLTPLFSIPSASVFDFLSTGDLLLFRTKSTLSKMQRSLTSSSWDHIGMIIQRPILSKNKSNLCLLESVNKGGIKCNPLEGVMMEWRRKGLIKLEKRRKKLLRAMSSTAVPASSSNSNTNLNVGSSGSQSVTPATPVPLTQLENVSASSLASAQKKKQSSAFPTISIRKLYNWQPSDETLLQLEEFVDSIIGNSYSMKGIFKLGRKKISEMIGGPSPSPPTTTPNAALVTSGIVKQTSPDPSPNPPATLLKHSYFCSELIAACYRVADLLPPAAAADDPTISATYSNPNNPFLHKPIGDFLPGDFSTESIEKRQALDQILWEKGGVKLGEEIRIDLESEVVKSPSPPSSTPPVRPMTGSPSPAPSTASSTSSLVSPRIVTARKNTLDDAKPQSRPERRLSRDKSLPLPLGTTRKPSNSLNSTTPHDLSPNSTTNSATTDLSPSSTSHQAPPRHLSKAQSLSFTSSSSALFFPSDRRISAPGDWEDEVDGEDEADEEGEQGGDGAGDDGPHGSPTLQQRRQIRQMFMNAHGGNTESPSSNSSMNTKSPSGLPTSAGSITPSSDSPSTRTRRSSLPTQFSFADQQQQQQQQQQQAQSKAERILGTSGSGSGSGAPPKAGRKSRQVVDFVGGPMPASSPRSHSTIIANTHTSSTSAAATPSSKSLTKIQQLMGVPFASGSSTATTTPSASPGVSPPTSTNLRFLTVDTNTHHQTSSTPTSPIVTTSLTTAALVSPTHTNETATRHPSHAKLKALLGASPPAVQPQRLPKPGTKGNQNKVRAMMGESVSFASSPTASSERPKAIRRHASGIVASTSNNSNRSNDNTNISRDELDFPLVMSSSSLPSQSSGSFLSSSPPAIELPPLTGGQSVPLPSSTPAASPIEIPNESYSTPPTTNAVPIHPLTSAVTTTGTISPIEPTTD